MDGAGGPYIIGPVIPGKRGAMNTGAAAASGGASGPWVTIPCGSSQNRPALLPPVGHAGVASSGRSLDACRCFMLSYMTIRSETLSGSAGAMNLLLLLLLLLDAVAGAGAGAADFVGGGFWNGLAACWFSLGVGGRRETKRKNESTDGSRE